MILKMFKPPSDIYGSAAFMGYWERRRLLNRKHTGLVIDGLNRLSEDLSFRHCLIAAPTGRGKTSRFVIPNVLWAAGQSFVITDPAGEIYRTCATYLERTGYVIKTLNPQAVSQSDRYNPLERVGGHSSIRKLCGLLVSNALDSQSADPFWNESAVSLLSLLIKCVKAMPVAFQHLGEVYRLLNLLLSDQDQVTDLMKLHLDGDSLREYLGFIKQDKTFSSIVATAKAALHKFGDPDIETLTKTNTIVLESLRQQPTAIFLMIPDKDASGLVFLLTIFYAQLFSFCMSPSTGSNYLPIYLLLDEFGNLGKIPNFSMAITTLRKWKVSVTLLLQDLQQIAKTYGKEDLSIIVNGGCTSRLFFPGLSVETCELVERMLGKKTVIHRRHDPAKWELVGQRDDFSEIGRSLMTATEINQLKDHQALFFHSNKRPVLLKTMDWRRHPILKKRGIQQ